MDVIIERAVKWIADYRNMAGSFLLPRRVVSQQPVTKTQDGGSLGLVILLFCVFSTSSKILEVIYTDLFEIE
jgi:hypothetical protein